MGDPLYVDDAEVDLGNYTVHDVLRLRSNVISFPDGDLVLQMYLATFDERIVNEDCEHRRGMSDLCLPIRSVLIPGVVDWDVCSQTVRRDHPTCLRLLG